MPVKPGLNFSRIHLVFNKNSVFLILITTLPGITRHSLHVAAVCDDDDDKSYCPYCKKYNFELNKLGPLLLDEDEGEERPADFDRWVQCCRCGKKFPKRELKHEGQITDFIDLEDVEDSDSEPVVETVFKRGRKTRLQRFRDTQNQSRSKINDPDALAAIKKGLKVTNYEEYQIE